MCRGRAARGRARAGFTLMALLLVLAAMTLVVTMALQLGQEERRGASLVRHDARALAIAEVGMERTRAYLASVLATNADLDVALDPKLNTECTGLPVLGGGQDDDHLPFFSDGAPVVMPDSGKSFYRVPYNDGAYLVRIDDNDDDGDSPATPFTTSNNLGTGCVEGSGKNNPVRDRDQTVIITVVGIYPGTDVAAAQARKVLRVRVGPQPTSGIIAGGTIDMGGSSHVCGVFGDIFSSGDITGGGCMCGTGCHGGPPAYQQCAANTACVAQSAGSTCNATGGGSGSMCVPGAVVPPPPSVSVWSSLNAPPGCTGTVCTPFYYLSDSGSAVKVHMWDYTQTACKVPQACPRIPHPGESTGVCKDCWKPVYDGSSCAAKPHEVRLKDSPLLAQPSPSSTAPSWTGTCNNSSIPLVWTASSMGYSTASGCDTGSGTYPGDGPQWSQHTSWSTEFTNAGTLLPRGVWMVEGNATFSGTSPDCASLSALGPGWGATVLAQGNVFIDGKLYLRSAVPRGIVLLAGRDMQLKTGNTLLDTCNTSAAIMVHEQFEMGSNSHLEGQLVVENAGHCSSLATSPAIYLRGNATINVSQAPPIASGDPASVLDWGESSY